MAQRYVSADAHERMERNACPECGESASEHLADNRFWIPRRCDLTKTGVDERIEQFIADLVKGQQ